MLQGYTYGDWQRNLGICPVPPGHLVEVKYADELGPITNLPEYLDWEILEVDIDGDNIVEYRTVAYTGIIK